MNKEKIQLLANELAKEIKTPDDLTQLSAMLTKMTVEAELSSEMDFHLGDDKHHAREQNERNSRNGYSIKIVKGNHGEIEIQTPRDRDSSFEPQRVKKRQTRITPSKNKIFNNKNKHIYLVFLYFHSGD